CRALALQRGATGERGSSTRDGWRRAGAAPTRFERGPEDDSGGAACGSEESGDAERPELRRVAVGGSADRGGGGRGAYRAVRADPRDGRWAHRSWAQAKAQRGRVHDPRESPPVRDRRWHGAARRRRGREQAVRRRDRGGVQRGGEAERGAGAGALEARESRAKRDPSRERAHLSPSARERRIRG